MHIKYSCLILQHFRVTKVLNFSLPIHPLTFITKVLHCATGVSTNTEILLSLIKALIRVSLSDPHTSGKNGTSIVSAKIYMEIWINGMSVTRS